MLNTNNVNIFITGSNGFIGSHLKHYLQSNYENYNLLIPSSKDLDLTNEHDVDNYIFSNKIDIIIHLANHGGDRKTVDFKNIVEYNLRIFFNIAKHEKNVKKIISFGSGAEYSKHKPIVNAQEEDYLKSQPLDGYGLYKSITSKYIAKSDKIIQLRIFGVFGEYEDYRYRFISNAIVKNLFHLPITINKNVYFDYIYINDLVKILDWFILNNTKEKVYNVSTGKKVDLLTLSNIVNEISDFKSNIKIINSGLNNEYTSSNDRLMKAIEKFTFTSHTKAIINMRQYFIDNKKTLDKDAVMKDMYLKKIDV